MQRNLNLKNRMREIRSSGTVGVRGGNDPLYPEKEKNTCAYAHVLVTTTIISLSSFKYCPADRDHFKRIKQIEFPLCSIKIQQRIVDELESKLTICDKMEETITQSLQQAETLRQSILKMAFEGKLI